MRVKAAIAFTRCPIGKWERENDITQDQLSVLRSVMEQIKAERVTHEQNVGITNLYNEIFGFRKKISSCGTCVKQLVKELKQILDSYEE